MEGGLEFLYFITGAINISPGDLGIIHVRNVDDVQGIGSGYVKIVGIIDRGKKSGIITELLKAFYQTYGSLSHKFINIEGCSGQGIKSFILGYWVLIHRCCLEKVSGLHISTIRDL